MSETSERQLQINLFGAFDVRVNGKPLPSLRSIKGQHLLALLVLRHDREVTRLWLAETLWPDSIQADALASLRQSLADLRRAMGEQAARLQSPAATTLRLNVSDAEVDLIAFDKAIKRGDAESLKHAVALYRGDLLEGASEAWILGEREVRRQNYLNSLEYLAALAHAEGDAAGEVAYLRRVASYDSLRETAQQALMQALTKAGEFQAAIEVYQKFSRDLSAQGAQPSAATRSVYQQIRDQARQSAQKRDFMPLAESRIITGSVENLRGYKTPLPQGNLPLPLTSLIGREELLHELKARMLTSRLVTLTGTGGVGKTRLATQAAWELADDFADGAWFADLSALSPDASAERIAQEIAGMLAISLRVGQSWRNALAEALVGRHLLLVLDNCETLLASCVQFVQELLPACARLHVLATSRQRLGLTSEWVCPVPPLAVPEPQDDLPAALTFAAPAIRLFVERAQAVCPAFTPDAANGKAIAEVCRRLDGLPLALELAAALIEALTPEEIARHLRDSLALLDEEDTTRPPRHRSLRALLDSSVSLLSERERLALRRASVFIGGWTLAAAEALEGEGENREPLWQQGSKSTNERTISGHSLPVLPLTPSPPLPLFPALRGLVSKSLVVAEEHDGTMRYRLLETIHEYAAEELAAAGEAARTRDRHLAYYAQLAERAERGLTGPEQAAWLLTLDRESGNLRAALHWAELNESSSLRGLQMAGALGRYWQIRGHFAEGRDQITRLLQTPNGQAQSLAHANALNWAALLSVFLGDFKSAQQMCERAFALWQQWENSKAGVGSETAAETANGETYDTAKKQTAVLAGMAGTLGILGIIAANAGNNEQARRLYGQSLERARSAGDRLGVAGTLGYLGIVAANQGYYEEARTCYEESLRLRRELQDTWGIAACLNNLGQLARKQGDLDLARDLVMQSLTLRRELRDPRSMGISLNMLSLIAWQQNDMGAATTYCREALLLFVRLGDQRSIAYGLEMEARLAAARSDPKQAARLYGAAQHIRERIGSPLPLHEQQELDAAMQPVIIQLQESVFTTLCEEARYLPLETLTAEAQEQSCLS